jgi:Phosphoketolase
MSTVEANIPAQDAELSVYGPTRSTIKATPLSADELRKTETYWRACNYLSLGMIYLQENPLLKEPYGLSTSRTGCSAIGDRAPDCRSCTSISTG